MSESTAETPISSDGTIYVTHRTIEDMRWHTDVSRICLSELDDKAHLTALVKMDAQDSPIPFSIQGFLSRTGDIDHETGRVDWGAIQFDLGDCVGVRSTAMVELRVREALRDNEELGFKVLRNTTPETLDELRAHPQLAEITEPFERFVIARDEGYDLDMIAQKTHTVSSRQREDGKAGRWSEIHVYETLHGQRVVVQIGRSTVRNEKDRTDARVIKTEDQLKEFLGMGWLAKKLYAQLGVETAQKIA